MPERWLGLSERIVRAVAERLLAGMLAPAEPVFSRLLNFNLDWLEFTAGVRAITEWLLAGPAAAAPPVSSGFQIFFKRRFLRDNGF